MQVPSVASILRMNDRHKRHECIHNSSEEEPGEKIDFDMTPFGWKSSNTIEKKEYNNNRDEQSRTCARTLVYMCVCVCVCVL